MPQIRYVPGPEDKSWTVWNGVRFNANTWVDIDDKKHLVEVPVPKKHVDALGNEFTRTTLEMVPMSEMARTNRHFEVRKDKDSKIEQSAVDKQRKAGVVETPEDYKAYAVEWINEGQDPDEMKARWRREAPLRDKVGAKGEIEEEIFDHFTAKASMLEMMQD